MSLVSNSFKFDVENTLQNLLSLWPKELFWTFFFIRCRLNDTAAAASFSCSLVAWYGMGQG